MTLVDWQIRELCDDGLIFPYNKDHVNPSSIDVRLGDEILVETDEGFVAVSLGAYYSTYGHHFQLLPGEFILACTFEVIKMPHNVSAEFKLKSSRAREGWGHSLAAWIDPNFQGSLTLELKNYTKKQKLNVVQGLKIGQIIFSEHKKPINVYENTDYSYKQIPVTSRDKN